MKNRALIQRALVDETNDTGDRRLAMVELMMGALDTVVGPKYEEMPKASS